MLNLFAFRSRHIKVMQAAADPIGPENDAVLRQVVPQCQWTICCWGNGTFDGRDMQVVRLLREDLGRTLYCFGFNRGGQPKHPLFLKGTTEVMEWH